MFSLFKKKNNIKTDAQENKQSASVAAKKITPPKAEKSETVKKSAKPGLTQKEKEVLNKCISDFSKVLKNESIGDELTETTHHFFQPNEKQAYGLVVFGTKCYFSNNILEGLKKYVPLGLQVVFILDRTIKKEEDIYKNVRELETYPNVTSFYLSRGKTTAERISLALQVLDTEFIGLFTLNDKINFRSFDLHIKQSVIENWEKDVISFENISDNYFDTASLTGISGVFFKKKYLENQVNSLKPNTDYWMRFFLTNGLDQNKYADLSNKKKYLWCVNTNDFSVPDLAFFFKDAIEILKLIDKSKENIENFVDAVINNLSNALINKKTSDNKIALMASGVAIFCVNLKKYYTEDEWRDIIYRFSVLFDFDQITKKAFLHNIHRKICEAVFAVQENTVSVIETDFMQDLKESFLPALEKNFNVIYDSKPQYYDYHFLYCMVLRAEIQPSQYVITSNDMHKYITGGKQVITLWHGLGMLKKIAEADRVKYPMNYIVTSSESCVGPWSETFQLPIDHVLPFGQVQTDILYNEEYLNKCSKSVRKQYNIPDDAQIVFFAPTFRINGNDKYYDMCVDIEELSKELKKKNIYMITKKHHVFSHILKDKGIDTSGVCNSKTGNFIVDESHTFVELICASNKFVTDYSSGLFYAFVRKIPVILYAPDVEQYKEGANGFMINYPEDIPAPFVGKGDIKKLIKAFDESESYPEKEPYQLFRDTHVGSCDGHAGDKLVKFFLSLNKTN